MAGGTDESLALQKAAANEAMGETMANVAAQAADYKDSVEEQYRQNEAALNQQEIANEQNKAQSIAAAAGQMGSAVSGLMSGIGAGKDAKTITTAAAPAKTVTDTPAYDSGDLQNAVAQNAKAALGNGPAEIMGEDKLPKKRV